MNFLIVYICKLISLVSRIANLGNGSTWPGHIALKLNKNFVNDYLQNSKTKTILIVGTNGKTTTSKLIRTILKKNGKTFLHNKSGANLLNGVASSIIFSTNLFTKLDKDFAIFEIDENALSVITNSINPDYIVAINLFRDQLDRYGELNSISKKWTDAISKLKDTTLILNADDPEIAFLGKNSKLKTLYFGLEENELKNQVLQHGADSLLCPNCGFKLTFKSYYFSHLGDYECINCKFMRPKPDLSKFSFYPLTGTYALYDIFASVLLAKTIGIKDSEIESALREFKPAFGRQETINYMGKDIQIFLAKNPISFNESLSTIKDLGGKNLLIILNDNIPDGLDISWIWDIEFESILEKDMNVTVAGERKYDMALRLKYAGQFVFIAENIEQAINKIVSNLEPDEKLFVLPNYSAMLETRKILTGKEIL